MSESTLFKPRAYPIREPLSNKRMHGRVVNFPRLAEIGGMKIDSAPKAHFAIKKPGDTL